MAGNFDGLLDQGSHIPDDMLLDYLEGKLAAKESHRVEKHLLDCELCSDTLDGLKLGQDPASKEIISGLNKKIDERIESINDKKGKIISFKPYYRIAAVITIFILAGGGYWFLKNQEKEKVLAENTATPATITDSVSPQFVPQVSSDQKAVEPIANKPQFSLAEKNSAPLNQTVQPQENKQVALNDDKKKEDEVKKIFNDDSIQKNLESEADVNTTEGVTVQSSKAKDVESKAGTAAPSVAESEGYSRKEKANVRESVERRDGSFIVAEEPGKLFTRAKQNYDLKRYKEATIDFERLLNDTSTAYYDDAKWFLANCYAKTYKNAKSRKLLKEIAASKSIHIKEAEGLLQESE